MGKLIDGQNDTDLQRFCGCVFLFCFVLGTRGASCVAAAVQRRHSAAQFSGGIMFFLLTVPWVTMPSSSSSAFWPLHQRCGPHCADLDRAPLLLLAQGELNRGMGGGRDNLGTKHDSQAKTRIAVCIECIFLTKGIV